MKFRVTMKDPDTLSDSAQAAAFRSVMEIPDLNEEERKAIAARRGTEYYNAASKWFTYGEYVTIEIDTEEGTATVVPKAK